MLFTVFPFYISHGFFTKVDSHYTPEFTIVTFHTNLWSFYCAISLYKKRNTELQATNIVNVQCDSCH